MQTIKNILLATGNLEVAEWQDFVDLIPIFNLQSKRRELIFKFYLVGGGTRNMILLRIYYQDKTAKLLRLAFMSSTLLERYKRLVVGYCFSSHNRDIAYNKVEIKW